MSISTLSIQAKVEGFALIKGKVKMALIALSQTNEDIDIQFFV
jgi:hypothetical protein